MSSIPPYIAELPLKAADAGVFRLFPGQLLRGRIAAITAGEVTIDLGYTTLSAKAAGLTLTQGQRVLLQVGQVGPDLLTLTILADPSPALTLPSTGPTDPALLLAGLGIPDGDPLLALATQLQQQPGASALPTPLLAALALAFGSEAPTVLAKVLAKALAGSRSGAPTPPTEVEGLLALLREAFADPARLGSSEVRQLATATQGALGDSASALSLALTALAGHTVRYHPLGDRAGALLIEETHGSTSEEHAAYRFTAALDLPALGLIGVQCLYAPAACIARVSSASPEALAALQGPLETAAGVLKVRLGRPVAITTRAEIPRDPLTSWLEEQPWRWRGAMSPDAGAFVDETI